MRLTHVHHGPSLGWYLAGWQRHPKIFIIMAEALALSHSQDQANCQMLFEAKSIISLNVYQSIGQNSTKTQTIDIGAFSIAIIIVQALSANNAVSTFNYPIYIIPNMPSSGFTVYTSDTTPMNSKYMQYALLSFTTTGTSITFTITTRTYGVEFDMSGIIAVIS